MPWFVPRPSGGLLWWSAIALLSLAGALREAVKYYTASRKEDR